MAHAKISLLVCFSIAIAGLALSSCRRTQPLPKPEILIAAAADLTPAFQEIGPLFEQATGVRATFSFGSTGNLAMQIENGLPMDVFAAADTAFLDRLEKSGLILSDSRSLYARGRITIWTKGDSPLLLDRLEDLARPEVRTIAIANPGHAPYGLAAQQALQSVKIWDRVKDKCVFGEDVRQTLQYAQTGNVDAAIVALSLSVQSSGRWTLIPQELHHPLDQALAVLKATRHEAQARRFTAFINGPQGRPIMRKYGFILPGEEPAR